MSQEIISKVWQMAGLFGTVTPGLLVYENGKVNFVTEEGIQFAVGLTELQQVKWPFLRMGMGFDTVVNGKKYQFSFSKPNPSAPELGDSNAEILLRGIGVGKFWDSIATLSNIKTDKATTRQWKELLKG
ncbi:MAG: hypothetical protein ABIR30_00155 [Chitinophagaceae bacterium]